jgi:PadR family transcriptional regulator PadR
VFKYVVMKRRATSRPDPPAATDVLGGFEHQVLLALVRMGSEGYSVPVVLELEQRTSRSVAPAAVFVTLRRLEKRGLLRSRMATREPGQVGRTHRVFAVTPKGLDALRRSKRVLASLWDGVTALEER